MHGSTNHADDVRVQSEAGDDLSRQARQLFVSEFPHYCDSIDSLLKTISAHGPKGSAEPLRHTAEALAGAAAPAGFPKVSERAAELARLAAQADKGFNIEVARGHLEALRETFSHENPPALSRAGDPIAPLSEPECPTRILVVNAQTSERDAVSDYLQLAGYEPIALASGDLVLEAARTHRPAAIVLDADLPGIDGFSACRLLKMDAQLAGIPVILMATRADFEEKMPGLTPGVDDDYVLKPVDARELLLHIDKALRRANTAASALDRQSP